MYYSYCNIVLKQFNLSENFIQVLKALRCTMRCIKMNEWIFLTHQVTFDLISEICIKMANKTQLSELNITYAFNLCKSCSSLTNHLFISSDISESHQHSIMTFDTTGTRRNALGDCREVQMSSPPPKTRRKRHEMWRRQEGTKWIFSQQCHHRANHVQTCRGPH